MAMYIMDDGIRLHAELDMPEGDPGTFPLVIIIHGFTGHMDEPHITGVSEMLNRNGFATLRAEMYGHGASEGLFCYHTLYKWLGNILAVYDHAKNTDGVTDIYLCGHSQGGLAVMLAAAMLKDGIRGLILLSPAVCIPEEMRSGVFLGNRFDPEHIPDMIRLPGGEILSGNYVRVAQTLHVEDSYSMYKGPVLLVHGDEDETVPLMWSEQAAEQYSSAELAVIKGDTHCYDYHLEEVLTVVQRWIKTH